MYCSFLICWTESLLAFLLSCVDPSVCLARSLLPLSLLSRAFHIQLHRAFRVFDWVAPSISSWVTTCFSAWPGRSFLSHSAGSLLPFLLDHFAPSCFIRLNSTFLFGLTGSLLPILLGWVAISCLALLLFPRLLGRVALFQCAGLARSFRV